MLFIGTSAKNGNGIDEVFEQILDTVEKSEVEFYEPRARQGTIAIQNKDVKKVEKKGKGKDGGCAC